MKKMTLSAIRRSGIAALVGAGLVLGGVTVASASSNRHGAPAYGLGDAATVVSYTAPTTSAGTLTVSVGRGANLTYAVATTVVYEKNGTADPADQALVVAGARVRLTFASPATTPPTVAVIDVAANTPPSTPTTMLARPAYASGQLSSVADNSGILTLTMRNGKVYTSSSATPSVTAGSATVASTYLTAGQQVRLTLTAPGATTFSAVRIGLVAIEGYVVSTSGSSSITITQTDGLNLTVLVGTPTTTYTLNGAASSISAATPGSAIVARGIVASGQTTIDALTVAIGNERH